MKKCICIILIVMSVIGITYNVLSYPFVNAQHAYIEGVSYTSLDGKEKVRGGNLYIPIFTYTADKAWFHGAIEDYARGVLLFRKEAEQNDNMLSQGVIDMYDASAKIDEAIAEHLTPVGTVKRYPLCARDLITDYKLSRDSIVLILSGMKKGPELASFNAAAHAKKLAPKVNIYDIFIICCTVAIPVTVIYIVFLIVFAIKGKRR